MASKRPLVLTNGQIQQIQAGDVIDPAFYTGGGGSSDVTRVLAADSTIASNACRVVAGAYTIPDGFTLTINDNGELLIL